jgi:hypothetical protein
MLFTKVASIGRLFILLGNNGELVAGGFALLKLFFRAHVHPRVIGFNGADHEEFERLEQARNAMKERMIERYDEALKPKARELVGEELRGKYYAVAYGYTIGVFQDWEYGLYHNMTER